MPSLFDIISVLCHFLAHDLPTLKSLSRAHSIFANLTAPYLYRSCNPRVTGRGFKNVRRFLQAHGRVRDAMSRLTIRGEPCSDCETSPLLLWTDLISVLDISPTLRDVRIHHFHIDTGGPLSILAGLPITLEMVNVTLDDSSNPIGYLLRALPLTRVVLINNDIPMATQWDHVGIDVNTVSITWPRPLDLQEVQAVPIFSGTTSLTTFNMTDVALHTMFQLHLLLCGLKRTLLHAPTLQTSTFKCQWTFGLAKKIINKGYMGLPFTVIRVTVEMSYYAWERLGEKHLNGAMDWPRLDHAFLHLPLLEMVTIQWLTGPILGSSVLDTERGDVAEWAQDGKVMISNGLPNTSRRAHIRFKQRFSMEYIALC
ncbi:hypothetical protein BDW22DRAFT_1348407 [Trametopsis cervina]|nr:hypothetical protein BDW22DRAFT_1348407 [Trametopsis cervina]